jgi:uncharacterized membrane protein
MKLLLCSLIIIICSFLGILDAGFITLEKILGVIPPCTANFQCQNVLESRWANVGPVPLSALGIAFYSVFFVFGLLNYFEVPHFSFLKKKVSVSKILLGLGICGGFFSMYLMYIMGIVLHAWCFYCLLSAINCIVLGITTTTLFFHQKKRQE